jgi:predicted dienelactone hydrolase
LSPARTFLAFAAALLLAAAPARAAGFQYGSAPDPDDKPLELAIWYPSDGALTSQPLGLFKQDVAYYGAIKGNTLPLVVVSHGTGGSAAGHYDTALALADAGFVVVALSHTGDNYKDRGYSFTPRNFIDRPRHVSRVIDFMLNAWDGHDRLDPSRIGIFGHSAGAATALITIGGNPDLYLAVLFCRDHPDDWGCQQAKGQGDAAARKASDWASPPEWRHDPRVTAAAIAAPALGYAFTKVGLETVTAPVQLWRAEDDKITPNRWFGDIVRDALPQPPEDHFVPKAGHYDFLAPCNDALATAAPEICQSAADFDRAAFHQEFNKALVAFFRAQLAPP